MKKTNKILSVFLALLMIVSIIPMSSITANAATSGSCGDNLTWTFDEATGTLTISGTGAMYDCYDFESYEYPWEKIQNDIINVVIEEGVTTIGDSAFGWCYNLSDITISDTVTTIGEYALSTTNLRTIYIPASVIEICDSALYQNRELEYIEVSEDNSLYSNDENGVLFNKDKTIIVQYPIGNSRESYIIPDSVRIVGDGAFDQAFYLTKVTIPEGVTTIENAAFLNCDFDNIYIPGSVISISALSLGDVANIEVDENNAVFSSDDFGVLYNKDKTTLIGYPSKNNRSRFVVPDSVKNISGYAFYGCDNLEEIILPNNLKVIDGDAFRYCDKLTSITLPESLLSIYISAFDDCENLNDIYFLGSEDGWKYIVNDIDAEINATIHFAKENAIKGDVDGNGTVTAQDMRLILAYISGAEALGSTYLAAADVNTDGELNSFDARLVNLYIAGLVTDFNVIPDEAVEAKEILVFYDNFEGVKKGEKVTINVVIPENSNFATLDMTFTYDSSRFGNSSIVSNNTFSAESYFDCGGVIKYAGVALDEVTERSTVLTIELEALKDIVDVIETEPRFDGSATDGDFKCVDTWFTGYLGSQEECEHNTVQTHIVDSSCTESGYYYEECVKCGEIVSEIVWTTPPTGHDFADGACLNCGMLNTGGSITIVPIPGTDCAHEFGEWVTDGNTQYRNCTVCGFEESQISTDGGKIQIESEDQPGYVFTAEHIEEDDDMYVVIEESVGGTSYILNAFDINLTDDKGNLVQPESAVKVKIPVRFSSDGTIYKVYRINEDGSYVDMNAYTEGGADEDFFVVFETDHFSTYVVVQEYNWEPFIIVEPSTTTIRYKDGIHLRARVTVYATMPEGWYVKWTCSNDNFKVTETNGGDDAVGFNDLKIVSDKNGYTEFTAILYDGEGNVLATETIEMRSKAGFFDKIGGFFRSLFGTTKIYEY